MFKKIFKFLMGYVIIKIVGKNKERFVNMCLDYGIYPYSVSPCGNDITLSVSMSDFLRMRPIARKSGVRVYILEKCGLKTYIKNNKKRVGFAVAGLMVIALVSIGTQYIWCVEITGLRQTDKEAVLELLEKNGVYVGAKKNKIADLTELKNSIIYNVDTINWAWLYVSGGKARLEVQEAVMPPGVVDKTTPTDIIAISDGFLREATVRRGQRRVNKGMNVAKGDVLVSGKVPVFVEGTEERYSYVNSDGRFIADTVRTETARFSKTELLKLPTGRRKTRISMEIFGKQYCGDYDKYYDASYMERENHDITLPLLGYTGVSIGKDTIYEIREVTDYLNPDEVLSRAREILEERIMKGVGVGAVKLSDTLTYTICEDGYIVTLKMYLRENIGIEIPRER